MLLDPHGRPLDPAIVTRERNDGWQNAWTGIGTPQDKTTAGRFLPTFRIMDQELRSLRDGSAVAARMVEDAPNEVFREGYDLVGRIRKERKSGTPTDAADDVLESDANDLRQWAEEKFQIDEQVCDAAIEGRWWGGCLLVLGLTDGGFPWEPVNEDRIESLDFVSLIDRRYAYTMSQYSSMLAPTIGRYGTSEIYLISNAIASSGWSEYSAVRPRPPKEIEKSGGMISYLHESRTLRFDGNPADVQSRQRLAGWSWSIMQRVYSELRAFEHAFDSVGYLLADASQGVVKIMGLLKAISAGQKEEIKLRALMFEQQRSVMRSIILDAGDGKGGNGESFERQPTPMAGYSDVLDRFMMRLSASTPEREPVSLLFGKSAGSLNATGDNEIRTWYGAVRSMGNRKIAPRLRHFYRLAALAKNSPMKGKKVDWAVTFKPLWAPTDKEIRDANLARAQTDQILVESEIIPEEVAALTWKDEYSALDVQSLEEGIENKVSVDPHENDPDTDPNLGLGEPLGPGAPIPTLGPSVSPEAGGVRQPKPTGGGAKGAPGAPTKQGPGTVKAKPKPAPKKPPPKGR